MALLSVSFQNHPADTLAKLGPTLPVDVVNLREIVQSPARKSEDTPAPSHPDIQPLLHKLIMEEKVHSTTALVDTGASMNCIDDALARKLNLRTIDQRRIGGAGGVKMHDVYSGGLWIEKLNWLYYGKLYGVHIEPQDVILGRDFLRRTLFVYNGAAGHISIAN